MDSLTTLQKLAFTGPYSSFQALRVKYLDLQVSYGNSGSFTAKSVWLVGSRPSGSLHPWGLSPLNWICAGLRITTEWSSTLFHTVCKLGIKLSFPLPKHVPFFIYHTWSSPMAGVWHFLPGFLPIFHPFFKIFISLYGLYRITCYIIAFSYIYIINLIILTLLSSVTLADPLPLSNQASFCFHVIFKKIFLFCWPNESN